MIRITFISAIDGKAQTRQYLNHAAAKAAFDVLTKDVGYYYAVVMVDVKTGAILRAYASGTFTRACERSTWAN